MSRIKNHRQKDVDRYIEFLQDVSNYSIDKTANNDIEFREIIKRCEVSNSTEFALKKLGIINMANDFKWTYEWGAPTESHAKQVLDFLYDWRKKKETNAKLPFGAEFETIVDKLLTISNDLKELLKTPENHPVSEEEANEQRRWELVKAIAPGFYSKLLPDNPNNLYGSLYNTANSHIIKAADNLLELYNQTKK